MKTKVKKAENKFTQLCVMTGTNLGDQTPEQFEEYFKEELEIEVKFEVVVETLPDLDENGNMDLDTGGRTDLFFYVNSKDVGKFAIPRFKYGVRWWEDVIKYNAEHNAHLYTAEFKEKYPPTW